MCSKYLTSIAFAFIIFLNFFIYSVYSLSIGVAPSTVELGEVEPGSEQLIDFYLMTDWDKDLVVYLSSAPALPYFYNPARVRHGYEFNLSETSEEQVYEEITFVENPVVLPPEKKKFKLDGGFVNANKRIGAILKIPTNAEPGYHAVRIKFTPRAETQGQGLGIGIITLSELYVVFKIPGKVVRSGYIAAFDSKRVGNGEMIKILFKNNGTVSIRVGGSLKVYKGNETITLKIVPDLIKPNDIATLHAYWDVTNIKEGNYNVSATVNWLTGEDYKEGRIEVQPPPIEMAPPPTTPAPAPFSSWMISTISTIMIIACLIIYWWIK
jgi:hypothetical protein